MLRQIHWVSPGSSKVQNRWEMLFCIFLLKQDFKQALKPCESTVKLSLEWHPSHKAKSEFAANVTKLSADAVSRFQAEWNVTYQYQITACWLDLISVTVAQVLLMLVGVVTCSPVKVRKLIMIIHYALLLDHISVTFM